jgi:hypothetical protein
MEAVSRTVRMQAALMLAAASPLALAGVPDDPGDALPPAGLRLYDMTTETGMPHLEENLRYAIVRQRRCLDPRDLSTSFWMLHDASLQDCRLEQSSRNESGATYDLRCVGGHGTSGGARWKFEPGQLRGTLDVKLGGKNMTFYQRIVAKVIGQCAVESSRPAAMP